MGSTCRFSSQSISCTRRPRVSLRSLAEMIINAIVVGSFVILLENVLTRTHLQTKSNILKKEPPSTKAVSICMKKDWKKNMTVKKE